MQRVTKIASIGVGILIIGLLGLMFFTKFEISSNSRDVKISLRGQRKIEEINLKIKPPAPSEPVKILWCQTVARVEQDHWDRDNPVEYRPGFFVFLIEIGDGHDYVITTDINGQTSASIHAAGCRRCNTVQKP